MGAAYISGAAGQATTEGTAEGGQGVLSYIDNHPSYNVVLRGKGGIYRIVHCPSGKAYIGRTGDFLDRWEAHLRDLHHHCHHSSYLQHTWNRDGSAAFCFEVLVEEVDPYKRLALEQYHLDKRLFEKGSKEYNMSHSSCGPVGVKHTIQARIHMSQAHLGQTRSQESITKQRATNASRMPTWKEIAWRDGIAQRNRGRLAGKPLSPEVRAKISATNRSKPLSAAQVAANIARRGRLISPKQREATLMRMQRPPTPAEIRERASRRGRTIHLTPEWLESIRGNQRIAAKASADKRRGQPRPHEHLRGALAYSQSRRDGHRALILDALAQLEWGTVLPDSISHFMASKTIAAIHGMNAISVFRSLNFMLDEGIITRSHTPAAEEA